MNTPIRATRLLGGVSLSGAARPGLMMDEKSPFKTLPNRERERRADISRSAAEDISLRIEEPMQFHRARYERLTRTLHGKCNLASALLTGLILIVLGWKAECGEPISAERWLWGVLSGWFIVSMFRIALFTCLAAPRFICCAHGKFQISGLGTLRTEQILHWSIDRKVLIHARTKRGARLRICCRWLGWERHWTMLMEEGQETERLQSLLEAQLPRTHIPTEQHVPRTIQIEAGVLSH